MSISGWWPVASARVAMRFTNSMASTKSLNFQSRTSLPLSSVQAGSPASRLRISVSVIFGIDSSSAPIPMLASRCGVRNRGTAEPRRQDRRRHAHDLFAELARRLHRHAQQDGDDAGGELSSSPARHPVQGDLNAGGFAVWPVRGQGIERVGDCPSRFLGAVASPDSKAQLSYLISRIWSGGPHASPPPSPAWLPGG